MWHDGCCGECNLRGTRSITNRMQPISKGWISSDISVLQPGKWIQRGDSGVLSEEFGEEVEKCLQVVQLTDC